MLNICDFANLFLRLTDTIWTSAWRVPSVESTSRCRNSQVLLAVVVHPTFTWGGAHAYSLTITT